MGNSKLWSNINLGDVAKVVSGFAFKSSDFLSNGIPVIKIKNIRIGTVDLSEIDYVDPSFLSLDKKYHVQGGDILISLTGSHLTQPNSVVGRVAIHSSRLGHCLLNQRAGKIIINRSDLIDQLFLFYSLCTNEKRQNIALMALGAANQANISPSQVESVNILLPPLPIQRKIAAILSTYDDLIENNTRRIKILEEMARALYREWFVNFRFPGHEQVKMVDSELGLIPEGWEVGKIDDIYRTSSGGTPSRNNPDFYGGSNLWIKTRELNDGFIFDTEEKITDLGLQKSSAKLFPSDTVIMAMYGATIGKLGILTSPASTNQACCAILTNNSSFSSYYAFLYLLENREKIFSLGMGAAQQNISQQVIKALEILKPSNEVMINFNNLVEPLFKTIKILQHKNINLRRTRDLLLPKLISGEIDVENLDIKTGEIAA